MNVICKLQSCKRRNCGKHYANRFIFFYDRVTRLIDWGLLWELRNLTDSRTLHLGPKHFPDPRFSGPYQHCRGMGPRSLLFQNSRACLSLLLTLRAIVYVSAGGRTPALARLSALGVACAFSPAPPQRRAFPRVRLCFG